MAQAKKTASKTSTASKGNNEELGRLRKENEELKKRLSRIATLAGGSASDDEDEDEFEEDEEDDEEEEEEEG